MKITAIRLNYTPPGQPFPFIFPITSGTVHDEYVIKAIQGLDPPDPTVRRIGTSLGQPVLEINPNEDRDLIIRMELNPAPDHTFEGLRDKLYGAIGNVLRLDFINGSSDVANVTGYISKFEATMYSNTPEIQITFKCFGGVFSGIYSTNVTVSSTGQALFEYEGTAPAPVRITATCTTESYYFRFLGNWNFNCDYDAAFGPFLVGDVLNLYTGRGRYFTLTRAGVSRTIVTRLTTDSNWPMVTPGTRYVDFNDADSFTVTTFNYIPMYWGV